MWICYYEAAKKQLNVKFLWRAAEKYVLERLDLQLCERWLNCVLHLITMDQTNAFLIYENFERRKLEDKEEKPQEDECLKLARMLSLHVMHKKCIFSRLLYCKLYQIIKDNKDDYAVERCYVNVLKDGKKMIIRRGKMKINCFF